WQPALLAAGAPQHAARRSARPARSRGAGERQPDRVAPGRLYPASRRVGGTFARSVPARREHRGRRATERTPDRDAYGRLPDLYRATAAGGVLVDQPGRRPDVVRRATRTRAL